MFLPTPLLDKIDTERKNRPQIPACGGGRRKIKTKESLPIGKTRVLRVLARVVSRERWKVLLLFFKMFFVCQMFPISIDFGDKFSNWAGLGKNKGPK